MGNIQGGKLRALAVTSAKRSNILPDVPTLAEAGVPGVKARHLGRKIDLFCFGNRGDRRAEAGSQ